MTEVDHDKFGIVHPLPHLITRTFGIPFKKANRGNHVGNLYLNHDKKGAKEDAEWFLDVYGRNQVEPLTKIIKDHLKQRDVLLQVNLVRETPKIESRYSDYDTFM